MMRVVVIDNIISPTAVYKLAGKDIHCYEYRENGFQPMRNQEMYSLSHGTVCGALAAEFLPDAELVGLSILAEQCELLVEHVRAAMEWCLRQSVDCICLSLGTTNWLGARPLAEICLRLARRGTHMVCAAGNQNLLTFPAAYPGVTGVRYDGDAQGVQKVGRTGLGYDLSVGFFESEVLDRLSREQEFFRTRSSSMAVPYAAGQLCKSGWSCRAFPRKEMEKRTVDPAMISELGALPVPLVRLHRVKGRGVPLARRFQAEEYAAVLVSPYIETDWSALTMRVESFAEFVVAAPSLREASLVVMDLPENWETPREVFDLEVDMAGKSVEETYQEIVCAFQEERE